MSYVKRLFEEIVELHEQDYTDRGIADTLNIDIETVQKTIAQWKEAQEDIKNGR